MRKVWAAVAITSVLSLTACGSTSHGAPLKPVPVSMSAHLSSSPIRIGVLYTAELGRPGSDWLRPANGTELAAYRFSQGGTKVEIVGADDTGTSSGAVAAMKSLISQGVAGVVVASEGSHLQGALAEANAAHVAVIAPYDSTLATLSNVWSTAPTAGAITANVKAAAANGGVAAKHPLVIIGTGGIDPNLPGEATLRLVDAPTVSRLIAAAINHNHPFDAFVVSGSAQDEAIAVAGVQGGGDHGVPVVAYPTAMSPQFGSVLVASKGTLAGTVATVGVDTGDTASLAASQDGERLAAFYAADRLAASSTLTDIAGGRFSLIAAYADTPSHDAVVALVRAAEAAKSTLASKVLKALAGLKLEGAAGLAGPALDFTKHQALPTSAVTILHSSAENPNVRPTGSLGESTLVYWFGTPAGTQ